MLETILEFIVIFFLFQYFIAPLFVWRQQKVPSRYKLILMTKEEIVAKLDDKYKAIDTEIKNIGYNYIQSAYTRQQDTETIFSIYTHPQSYSSISVVSITNPNVATNFYVEITQLFDDNTMLDVLNSSVIGAFPKSQTKVTFYYPNITNIEKLLSVFNTISKNYFSLKKPIKLSEENLLSNIEKLLNEEQDELIKKGYIQLSTSDGYRKLTLKGAYSMTWKLLWPIKQLRTYMTMKKSDKILIGLQ